MASLGLHEPSTEGQESRARRWTKKGQQPGRRGGDTSGCCRRRLLHVSYRSLEVAITVGYDWFLSKWIAKLKAIFRISNNELIARDNRFESAKLDESASNLYCASLSASRIGRRAELTSVVTIRSFSRLFYGLLRRTRRGLQKRNEPDLRELGGCVQSSRRE